MIEAKRKVSRFNIILPAAEASLLTAALTSENEAINFTIFVSIGVAGILRVARTNAGVTVVEDLNDGVALVANALYAFTIRMRGGDSINLRYSVGNAAATTCADLAGTCDGSPITFALGINTVNVTVAGTFTVTLPAGMTGIARTGTATVVGSPQALVAGANVVDTGVTVGTFTVELDGAIKDLTVDEES